MAEADNNSLLRQLLDSAKPFEPGRADTVANRQPAVERPLDGDVESTVSAIQFLVNGSHLDLATYSEWINLGIALKHTHAESGFTIWHQFSASAGGYEGEDECRVNWDNIKSHNAGRPLTMATYFAKAKELGWKFPRTAGRPKTDDDGDGGPVKGEDYAAYTVRLIEEAGQEVWLDQEDRPHVTYVADLPDGGSVKRHLPIEGSGYRAVLEMLFFQAAGNKVLKKEQADNAASLLAMKARTAGIRHASALRIGMHEGAIYVDLGTLDGAAVEIDSTGWRIVSQPPVRFIRGSRGTLPTPEMGGTFEDFKAHFNADDADLLRAIGFMIGTFNPAGPYPLLMVDGGPGSAKSSFTDKVLSLTDPPHQFKSGRMSFNSKEQDLHIAAQGVHVMCFDNISYFSAEAADMLCRVATGGGSGSRKLYSNDQYQQFVVVRPVVLSCIGVPSSRSDLLDRSLIIKAQPIQRRRTERRMQAEFNTARPKLFGFLLSCVSAALRNQANIDAAVDDDRLVLPRMADFATFVEGAAEQLNLAIGGFSALLREGQGALQMEAVSGNVVGAALLAYFSRVDAQPLTGSATNVLDTLRATNGNDHRWPASNKLAATLQRLSIGLHVLGIEWHMTQGERARQRGEIPHMADLIFQGSGIVSKTY